MPVIGPHITLTLERRDAIGYPYFVTILKITHAAWQLSHGQSGHFPHMQDLACVTMRLATMVGIFHLMA